MATYTVKRNQNIFDVASDIYGTIEGLFDLMISNSSLNLWNGVTEGTELIYHESFTPNSDMVKAMQNAGVEPINSERHIYYKEADYPKLLSLNVDANSMSGRFKFAGSGTIQIDWGDNSDLETITLGDETIVSHYFDNSAAQRTVTVYANKNEVHFSSIDLTGIGGDNLWFYGSFAVDWIYCDNQKISLVAFPLLNGYLQGVSLGDCQVCNIKALGKVWLTNLILLGNTYINQDFNDYIQYVLAHYDDRNPCRVTYEGGELSDEAIAAIQTIVGEDEWNAILQYWLFTINDEIYSGEPSNN